PSAPHHSAKTGNARCPRSTCDRRFGLDARPCGVLLFLIHAGAAKVVYALDSKSSGLNAHVGSTPTLGTTHYFLAVKISFTFCNLLCDNPVTGGDIMINNLTEVIKN